MIALVHARARADLVKNASEAVPHAGRWIPHNAARSALVVPQAHQGKVTAYPGYSTQD